ncbi:MAG TPA: hypothetical protein VK484_14675 [Ferruginibacter sp.]|nr:hypothetical protein [Ferruginibacter sp.]
MWKPINDCGKQLTVHSRVREKPGNGYKVYDIATVEFDQYHLQLVSENDQPPAEEQRQVLNCSQLVQYRFEVEMKDRYL